MARIVSVEDWLAALEPEIRAAVDRLREMVRRAAPHLDESIKWNAPNFSDGGRDRVTLGLHPKGGLRVVLHRGADARDTTGFVFKDPDGMASWPAPDRGVVTLVADDIDSRSAVLETLVRRWVAATDE